MKYLILFFSFLFSIISISQKHIEETSCTLFTIESPTDTIEYIRLDTNSNAKPILLFLQGSLPIPLIFDFGDFKHINIPFDISKIISNYHIVIIAMPKTPVIAKHTHLSKQYCYITDSTDQYSFLDSYLKADFLSNYVERTNKVIADLVKNKKWVNAKEIHLIGHSQGAKIAAVVVAENKHVKSVSLLGFNAYGRFDASIRRERQALKNGWVTKEEYLESIAERYRIWEEITNNPEDVNHRSWISFSIDYTPFLLKTNCPIFIGYGTEDLGAENCDLIPLLFIENGKTNYKIFPYIGLEHNFFEVTNGNTDYKKEGHWMDVMQDVLTWIEKEEQ